METLAERERESRELFHIYNNIISIENLLLSWQEFLRGKKKRKDVCEFSVKLGDNILLLHQELKEKTYCHGKYQAFKINDPKPRDIHKATVKDRLVHHAIYRIVYPYFDQKFIFDSYSCRIGKGTHKAIARFLHFGQKVCQNNSQTCWILKGDIRKFFASIDHQILKNILTKHIRDGNVLWLLSQIVDSFTSSQSSSKSLPAGRQGEGDYNVGLPLGNLTSQLLVNIYLNEFDHFVKRKLKIQYYIRYADDFVIFSEDKKYLEKQELEIEKFLKSELKLDLHPDKVFIKTLSSGVDFLGYVNFFDHRILRTKTKRRMLKKLSQKEREVEMAKLSKESYYQSLQSYFGVLKHCQGHKIMRKLLYEQ